MLELTKVSLTYLNTLELLKGVSLRVKNGQIVAILGANGAGKSITLKTISGLIRVEMHHITLSGAIEYSGKRIDRKLPEDIVRLGIVQVMEGHRVLEDLTAGENLVIGAHMCGLTRERKKRIDLIHAYFPELRALQQKRAGYLSGGEQQMLVIARAMMASPKVMLLDEISFGLAPLLIQRIFEILKKINIERGTSILIAEQNIRAALWIADFVYLMENGTIVLEGPKESLRDREKIREFYLGI